MPFAKRLALKLAAVVFTLSIYGLAVATATNAVFGKPDKLKTALAENKVYDGVAQSIIDQAVNKAKTSGDIPLDNPAVQAAAKKALTGTEIQRLSEQAIDGTYSWLEGQTETPSFTLDLSAMKQNVANSVGDAGQQHVESLPPCTVTQLRQLDPNTTDPFSLPCRPPGLNLNAERERLVNEAIASPDFLQDTAISSSDIKSADGQNPFERAKHIPTIFQWSQRLPWILAPVAVLTATALIFFHQTRRQGIKAIARKLLLAGILLLISMFVFSFIFDRIKPEAEIAETINLQDAIVAVVRSLGGDFNRVLLYFAIPYTVLGIGGLIALRFIKLGRAATLPSNPPRSRLPQ